MFLFGIAKISVIIIKRVIVITLSSRKVKSITIKERYGVIMYIEQFVMAYGVEHDRLRAILPDGYISLRPVLRINAEIRDHVLGYIEFNTAVERDQTRGWLNIGCFTNAPFERDSKTVNFKTDYLEITFAKVGLGGSCPAERDNDGCYFIKGTQHILREPEIITVNKEFCDCEFKWSFSGHDAFGKSMGVTLPAIPTEIRNVYPRAYFTVENAARIPCEQVLGAYSVSFER